jgi:dihydrofolate synthase/folylpolyglutamate synthase
LEEFLLKIDEAINWIHSRVKFGTRPGLMRIEKLLELVGNPEKKIKTIHVAGTNGKGSTTSFLASILIKQGLTVGTFTSPYITKFNERIEINGNYISDAELITLVKKYQPLVAELDKDENFAGITEFEIITAMAFDYFASAEVDVAVIEVGLGGMLDSTNVITPEVSVITTIGLDHQDILGETIEEIAAQKAGIIKENVPVVLGNITGAAKHVLLENAQAKKSDVYQFNKDFSITSEKEYKEWEEVFDFKNDKLEIQNIHSHLLGHHQMENASVAIETALLYSDIENFELRTETIMEGVADAFWPARMEKISEKPLIMIDGAHNPHAMLRLKENVETEFADRKIFILFSALTTKDILKMLEILVTIPNARVALTSFNYPKAVDLSTTSEYEHLPIDIISIWQFGIGDVLEKMKKDDILLITGSLYFVSQVREFLLRFHKK